MNSAKPIRDRKVIKDLLESLKSKPRFYLLVLMGLNTGLRITDMLNLKVKDVKNKEDIILIEKKTKKEKEFSLNNILKETIAKYVKRMKEEDYLFHAQGKHKNMRPMTRTAAHRMLNRAAKRIGYDKQISFHSLRKSYGLFFYEKTKDIRLLQKIYNHSSPSISLIYINLDQSEINRMTKEFELY